MAILSWKYRNLPFSWWEGINDIGFSEFSVTTLMVGFSRHDSLKSSSATSLLLNFMSLVLSNEPLTLLKELDSETSGGILTSNSEFDGLLILDDLSGILTSPFALMIDSLRDLEASFPSELSRGTTLGTIKELAVVWLIGFACEQTAGASFWVRDFFSSLILNELNIFDNLMDPAFTAGTGFSPAALQETGIPK